MNILERAYSLVINNNTRSWNIVAGWSKYYFNFKIKVVFTPSSHNVSASCIIIYNISVLSLSFVYLCCIDLFESKWLYQDFYSLNYLLPNLFFNTLSFLQILYSLYHTIFQIHRNSFQLSNILLFLNYSNNSDH